MKWKILMKYSKTHQCSNTYPIEGTLIKSTLAKCPVYFQNSEPRRIESLEKSKSSESKKIFCFFLVYAMSWCDFIAGWAGGTIGLGHPFDTVKVNQQAHDIGLLHSTRKISRHGWYNGFFRGLGFPLLANGSVNSLFFGSYALTLEAIIRNKKVDLTVNARELLEMDINQLVDYIERMEAEIQQMESDNSKIQATNMQCFMAGSAAGVIELCIACPVELIKIKLQSTAAGESATKKSMGPMELSRNIYSKFGIRGFFQGLPIMALRDIPARGIYMGSYHIASKEVRRWAGKDKVANVLGLFTAGGLAGTASWCSIIPIDVIKSRLQTEEYNSVRYRGIFDCARQIYNENGLRGFVRGGLPIALRAFPVNGATFLTIEFFNNFLCQYFPKLTKK